MIQAIYAGVSALQSFQTGIDVLANNVANVNTTGFKSSSTEFSNLFERALNTGSNTTNLQSGLGTRVSAITHDLSTGSYSQTDRSTDLAIRGNDGWFSLSGANDSQYFTRAGDFGYDAFVPEGGDVAQSLNRLVSQEGLFVLGTAGNNFTFDADAQYSDSGTSTVQGAYVLDENLDSLELNGATVQTALELPTRLIDPTQVSTEVSFEGNLGVDEETRIMSATVISPTDERNHLELVFNQSAVQVAPDISWDIVATVTTKDYDAGGGTGSLYDTQTGQAVFGQNGDLISFSGISLDNNGAPVDVDLGTGLDGIFSNGAPLTDYKYEADGTVSGELIAYNYNSRGEIVAAFDNGKNSVIGRVGIFHFANDKGLESLGGNKFQASNNSGEAVFYTQNNGSLNSRQLETSNVALETALTELIIMQRSYDAASKTITTADDLLKNALQM